MTCKELIKEAAKMWFFIVYVIIKYLINYIFVLFSIYIVHDEIKDKAFELELSWIGFETNGKHELVPKDLFEDAEKYAKEALKQESDSDEEIQ